MKSTHCPPPSLGAASSTRCLPIPAPGAAASRLPPPPLREARPLPAPSPPPPAGRSRYKLGRRCRRPPVLAVPPRRPALAVPAPAAAAAPLPAALLRRRRPPPRGTATIVDSSRDAAPDGGDAGALSSPINLAYFYGASPHSSEGSCSPAHSAPGSPGSDSDLSVSSRGGGRRDSSRGGARPALQAVEQHMGGGKQHRGPFQGVRVKNSVKELLLHFRSSKQMSSGTAAEDCKAQGGLVNYEQYTAELKSILGHGGKRKAPELLSDGPSFKRQANIHPHLLTPPQTPTSMDSMEETHKNEPKHDSSSDLLQNIINIKNESSPVSLNTVQVSWLHGVSSHSSPGEQYQDSPGTQTFSPSQKYQAFQDHTSQNMLDPPQHYPFPSSQNQELSQSYTSDASLEYRPFSASDQSPSYQPNTFESHELQYCPSQSFSSLLNDSEGSENISAPLQPLTSGHPQSDVSSHAQNFSLAPNNICGSLERSISLAALNVSLPHQNVARNTTQLGKSFFQWQVEQEENKLANISQDQFLAKDSDGDTFLHIAVAQGRRALSYVLARKMAALHMLDIKEHNGQSAFQVAVAANQHLIVQDLVSLGAQVNTTDCWGRTPLHVCAEKGHAQVLQAIQKGAMGSNQYVDLEATNYDGLTALHCAVLAHNAVLHELQNCQPPHSPEVQELLLRNKSLVETIKTLIQMGASVEAKDRKSGRSALHLAAEEANLELIRLFLELPNCLSFVNAKAYNGNTALHVAASLQYRVSQLDAVRLLMRKGADPSARNLENEQPVHLVPDGLVGEQIRRILKGKAIQQRASPF